MKIDFSRPITDLSGLAVMDGGEPLTLARVVALATLTPQPEDTAEAKVRMFDLALRTHGGGEVAMSAEEVAVLKARIGVAFPPLTVGRAWQLLENEE